jgi:hypothetical protein
MSVWTLWRLSLSSRDDVMSDTTAHCIKAHSVLLSEQWLDLDFQRCPAQCELLAGLCRSPQSILLLVHPLPYDGF